ncbi:MULTISPECIES: UvrD-helicase domain-containing protein [Acetobacterium]|nr:MULTISPECIES: UvrD-helicase domain-containing protein [Acetobacterium]
MADSLKNCFLVNAPAGSGKTTQIKAMVKKCILENPRDNILCITYTNRAADELSRDVDAKNVFIGTIHSFLNSFMKSYFSHRDILDLYYEVYEDKIKQRIDNSGQDDHIMASNNKYKDKYSELDFETVKKNIEKISYNKSPFNTLYYGGLSHDDLISFSKNIFDHYPIISKRISSKYQFIFIDEYQDTMSDVLKIFYNSVAGSNVQLYLFGDRMQQIYKNYDGSFEEQFECFDTTQALLTNYRSVTDVVLLLNNIYNDSPFNQDNSPEMKLLSADFQPRIVITDNISTSIDDIKKSDSNTLVLYLFNKERFSDIGALNLYQAFDCMEKYSFGKTYSAVNVLTTHYDDNPDPLMKLLYCLVEMVDNYQTQKYGLIVQTFKSYKSIFCEDGWYIKTHSDKQRLFNILKEIFDVFQDESKTISELLTVLERNSIVDSVYMEGVQSDDENKEAFNVPVIELIRVVKYLRNPKVSTQHGVKGESHDSVLFVADDSYKNPIVHMYRFFEMWGQLSISLKEFHQFYYDYINELSDLQNTIGMKISELKKDSFVKHEKVICEKISSILDQFRCNPYFEFICKERYRQFLVKPGVTKAKDCLKESSVFGVLSAYKLFYVGCSRARKNLTILMDQSKIKGDFEPQKNKFTEIGFKIE